MNKCLSLVIVFMLILFSSCIGNKEKQLKDGDFKYCVYFLNTDKTKLLKVKTEDSVFEHKELNTVIEEVINQLKTPSKASELPVLGEGIEIIKYEIVNHQLILYFNNEYLALPSDLEVLVRAAIVKTFEQIDNVHKVSFMIDEEPLKDSNNNVIGPMDKNSFVENMGTDINNYQEDVLYLYFADTDYKNLVKTAIKVMRRTNIPREKVILEYLFNGPIEDFEESVLPTIPNELKVNSLITKNGVCYIDFSEKNLSSESTVSGKLILYSIVNSLTEDNNIIKVKFSLDSNESAVYRGIPLDEAFEKNESLVIKEE